MPAWHEMDKYQHVLSEWHPANSKKAKESRTADQDDFLWICSRGHVYHDKLWQRLYKGRNCPVCKGSIELAAPGEAITDFYPELKGCAARYGFRAEDISVRSNCTLFCHQGHLFIFWGKNPQDHMGCPLCFAQEQAAQELAEYSPGDTLKSPISYRGSLAEDKLRRFLREEGLSLYPKETAIKLYEDFCNFPFATPDIIVKDAKVIIEYDGHLFHRGRDTKDRLKARLMEDTGWLVIRVRDRDLEKINPQDILAPSGPTKAIAQEIAKVCRSVAKNSAQPS